MFLRSRRPVLKATSHFSLLVLCVTHDRFNQDRTLLTWVNPQHDKIHHMTQTSDMLLTHHPSQRGRVPPPSTQFFLWLWFRYLSGPEEDKALGSLPLPSFKISPVVSEDRVFRRHAFKAEHQNMRTYYFAAETKEQMAHWMNALSLASILQKDTRWLLRFHP